MCVMPEVASQMPNQPSTCSGFHFNAHQTVQMGRFCKDMSPMASLTIKQKRPIWGAHRVLYGS